MEFGYYNFKTKKVKVILKYMKKIYKYTEAAFKKNHNVVLDFRLLIICLLP